MAGYEVSSLGEWVRERPRAVVVLVSLFVLGVCSVVALSRAGGSSQQPDRQALEQVAATPEPALTLPASSSQPSLSIPSSTPSPSPTATPGNVSAPTTPATSPATTAAPTTVRPAPPIPPPTTAPPTPTPTTPTPTPTSSPTPTPAPTVQPTTTASPAEDTAIVTVTNTSALAPTFRVNNSGFELILTGSSKEFEFTVEPDGSDTYALNILLAPGCFETGGNLGVEPGGSYAVTIVDDDNGCPSLATPTNWPSAP